MKKLIALLLAIVMVLGLVACGAKEEAKTEAPAATTEAPKAEEAPKEEAPKEEAPAEEAPAQEEVAIEVFVAQVDWADAWDVMEEKFEAEYPYIDLQHVGLGEQDFVQQRLAANDLPTIIQVNNTPVLDALVADDLLMDISGWPCADLVSDTYKAPYTKNGKLIGICQGAAFSTMFYNMTMLEEAGWTAPPANWDELLQCCADLAAAGYTTPLVTAAGKTTTSWMILECVLANLLNDADAAAAYQEDFMNGTFDWNVPGLADRMAAIAPYFLTGTATAHEEDAANYMADGLAAIALCGNWNGSMMVDAIETAGGVAACTLPAFGDGTTTWISNSPEDAFAVTVDPNRTEAEQAAVELFFNWMFEGENFMLIQNARGTVPVISSMTDDQISLPECMIPVVAEMGKAPAVLMGFNLWGGEFKDAACGKICGLLSGDNTAEDLVNTMVEMMPKSYKNQ